MPLYRGEYAPLHPKFPEGSSAACVTLHSPPDTSNLKNIEYTAEDNVAIEKHLRQMVETAWHPVRHALRVIMILVYLQLVFKKVGTVPMKPKEEKGCVDARLNVYGTQNLKVAGVYLQAA
jgi:alcohol oxidase